LCNLMLAIYYLLLGRYHITEEEIAKRYELYMHLTAIVPSVGVAIAGLPLTLYNNANLWCWIAAYPPGSEGFDGAHGNGIECTRGHGSWLYRWIFFYGPLWFIIIAVSVFMVMLTLSIRSEEKRFIEFMQSQNRANKSTRPDEENTESTDNTENDSTPNTSSVPALGPGPESFNLERSRKMFHQAAFYLFAFYLTWWAGTLNRLIQMGGDSYFFFMVAQTIFTPLQGFINWVVYRHGPCVA